MNEFGGIGDVAGGAILARAAEPDTGAIAGDGHTHEAACLNCGATLGGDYCHACGQRGHVHRTLGAFFHDLLHGVFHFEGKIWRTLPLLAWRPGELTRDYISGKRASFVSPIALFLFSVFLMFAVFGMIGGAVSFGGLEEINAVDSQLQDRREDVAKLERDRGTQIAARASVAAIDSKLDQARDDVAFLAEMKQRGVAEATMKKVDGEFQTKSAWLDHAYIEAKKNPTLLLYKLRTNAYKFSWLLIPLSVPLMWLLFPFSRRFRAYDHTVFVTYSLSFLTMLVIAVTLAVMMGFPLIVAALVLYVPVHMYRQLKGAYGLTRASAIWRTFILVVFSWLVLSLFGLGMLALGVLD